MVFPSPKASVHRLGVVPVARVVDLVAAHAHKHRRLPLAAHKLGPASGQQGRRVDRAREQVQAKHLRHRLVQPANHLVNAPQRASRAVLADAAVPRPAFSSAGVVLAAADLAAAKVVRPAVGASPSSIP